MVYYFHFIRFCGVPQGYLMTRNHLLKLARQRVYGDAYALRFATELRTAGAVNDARSRYTKRAQLLNTRARACFYGFLGCAVVLVGATGAMVADALASGRTGANPTLFANAVALALLGLLVTASVGVAAANARATTRDLLLCLAPVSESAPCPAARHAIEAGEPEVLAWRDLVVQERGELSVFDSSILQDIHHAALAARDPARVQDAYQSAAYLLFGITPASRAPAAA